MFYFIWGNKEIMRAHKYFYVLFFPVLLYTASPSRLLCTVKPEIQKETGATETTYELTTSKPTNTTQDFLSTINTLEAKLDFLRVIFPGKTLDTASIITYDTSISRLKTHYIVSLGQQYKKDKTITPSMQAQITLLKEFIALLKRVTLKIEILKIATQDVYHLTKRECENIQFELFTFLYARLEDYWVTGKKPCTIGNYYIAAQVLDRAPQALQESTLHAILHPFSQYQLKTFLEQDLYGSYPNLCDTYLLAMFSPDNTCAQALELLETHKIELQSSGKNPTRLKIFTAFYDNLTKRQYSFYEQEKAQSFDPLKTVLYFKHTAICHDQAYAQLIGSKQFRVYFERYDTIVREYLFNRSLDQRLPQVIEQLKKSNLPSDKQKKILEQTVTQELQDLISDMYALHKELKNLYAHHEKTFVKKLIANKKNKYCPLINDMLDVLQLIVCSIKQLNNPTLTMIVTELFPDNKTWLENKQSSGFLDLVQTVSQNPIAQKLAVQAIQKFAPKIFPDAAYVGPRLGLPAPTA